MTEIPEHLLKRSRERRSAIGGGDGDDASGSAPAKVAPAATPAAAASAPARVDAPTPVVVPPPPPDPAYVRTAKERKKIPFWAMLPLSILPVWVFMYVRSVQDQSVAVAGPRAVGEEVYGKCASCHGGAGEGGSGRPLNNGEVLATFPAIEDQMRWVAFATEKYKAAGVELYGNPEREGGPHLTGSYGVMGGWRGELTDAEILAVVCYVRYDISEADQDDDAYRAEYAEWCTPDAPKFAELEEGKTFADPDFANVGTEPKAGRSDPFPAEGGA